jgi:hypothetical protein
MLDGQEAYGYEEWYAFSRQEGENSTINRASTGNH